MANRINEMEKAQNASKQALAFSISKELLTVSNIANNIANKLNTANINLSKCWQGSAFDSTSKASKSLENDVIDISKKLKELSSSINSAAKEVYPAN